jgi:hypothetical protein
MLDLGRYLKQSSTAKGPQTSPIGGQHCSPTGPARYGLQGSLLQATGPEAQIRHLYNDPRKLVTPGQRPLHDTNASSLMSDMGT